MVRLEHFRDRPAEIRGAAASMPKMRYASSLISASRPSRVNASTPFRMPATMCRRNMSSISPRAVRTTVSSGRAEVGSAPRPRHGRPAFRAVMRFGHGAVLHGAITLRRATPDATCVGGTSDEMVEVAKRMPEVGPSKWRAIHFRIRVLPVYRRIVRLQIVT